MIIIALLALFIFAPELILACIIFVYLRELFKR